MPFLAVNPLRVMRNLSKHYNQRKWKDDKTKPSEREVELQNTLQGNY